MGPGKKRLLLASVFALVAATVAVRPAVASTMSAINDCEPTGVARFYCDVTVSGGVAPYSYAWIDVREAAITKNDGWLVSGQCFSFKVTYELQVTVTDSTGAQLVDQLSGVCSTMPA